MLEFGIKRTQEILSNCTTTPSDDNENLISYFPLNNMDTSNHIENAATTVNTENLTCSHKATIE